MTEAPENGARFELSRESVEVAHATFVVRVHEAGGPFEARTRISATQVETTWTPEPPRWIAETTHGFLKTLQKNHASDASWPERLVRWRSER